MDAIALLKQRRDELARIPPANARPLNEWIIKTRPVFQQFFGNQLEDFDEISRSITNLPVWSTGYIGSTTASGQTWEMEKRKLSSLVDGLLELHQLTAPFPGRPKMERLGRKVFLVHGRNERWLHEVARFLETLQLEVIVLHEQPNAGRTIIEKFEDYSDVSFAVVLLTGDDRGGLANQTTDEWKLRARQNVILELGFFLGALGRQSVCVLFDPNVEMPSDYSGVVFVPLREDAAWHLPLAREIKAAGLEIDLNTLSAR